MTRWVSSLGERVSSVSKKSNENVWGFYIWADCSRNNVKCHHTHFFLNRQGEKLDSQVSLHIVWDHGTEFWIMECASKGCEPRHPLAFLVRPQCLVVLRDGRS